MYKLGKAFYFRIIMHFLIFKNNAIRRNMQKTQGYADLSYLEMYETDNSYINRDNQFKRITEI